MREKYLSIYKCCYYTSGAALLAKTCANTICVSCWTKNKNNSKPSLRFCALIKLKYQAQKTKYNIMFLNLLKS